MGFLDSLFGGGRAATATGATGPETETARQIADALDEMDPDRARYVACFAYLLGRVAHADLEIGKGETRAMENLVVERGDLPEDQAIIVVQIAKQQNRLFGGTEDYLVAREFGKIASRQQKLALIDCLYAVSASEDGISTVEDNEISKIASELRLSRTDIADARGAWAGKLNVLRGEEDEGSA